MSSPQIILLLIAFVDFPLGGLISNSFIITVVLREWTKRRSLASSEQLLLSLALCNFWVTVSVTPFYVSVYFTNIFMKKFAFLIMVLIAECLVISRHWLTAWLCVFYCLKIVNSTHSLFLWCKLRVSWLIPRLLLGSLVISLSIVCSRFHCVLPLSLSNTTENVISITEEVLLNRTLGIPELLVLTVGSGCPFLVVSLCSVLVVASLCRHVCRMKGKEPHSRSLQTKAHVKAAGTVLFLLFLYLSFYVAHTLSLTTTLRKNQGFVFSTVVMVYPSAQAYILLLVNPKLYHAATQMLQRTKA